MKSQELLSDKPAPSLMNKGKCKVFIQTHQCNDVTHHLLFVQEK